MTETLFYKLFIGDCELNNKIGFMVYIDSFLLKKGSINNHLMSLQVY